MRKWEGWFAWCCINQAMRSEIVRSLGFGEKYTLIDTWNEDLYRLIPRRKNSPFFFNTSTPSTYILILFGSSLALPNFPTHFCQACLKLEVHLRTAVAVAPHPQTVTPARRGRTAPSHSRSCTPQTQPRERALTDTCCRMWTNQT